MHCIICVRTVFNTDIHCVYHMSTCLVVLANTVIAKYLDNKHCHVLQCVKMLLWDVTSRKKVQQQK
jgi:hypothetical protein